MASATSPQPAPPGGGPTIWYVGGEDIRMRIPMLLALREHGWQVGAVGSEDPDVFEPNHIYTAGPPLFSAVTRHRPHAVELDVLDCTVGDCCDSETWTEGWIGFAYDQD